jgi:two-component system phosphate regulon response regulator PhoB
MPSVLIVEDDPDIRDLVRVSLPQDEWEILEAADGLEGVNLAREHLPSVILLDLMLPEMDGYKVFEELKRTPSTESIPVIMLTAKGTEYDRIRGLGLGADDYVTKPFSPKELALRARNLAKRRERGQGGTLVFGPFRLERSTLKLTVEDVPVELTATEFKLLLILLEGVGRDQMRGDLLRRIWGYDERIQTRTLDTHVKRLREKLGAYGDCIETIRGVGYRFQPSDPGQGDAG